MKSIKGNIPKKITYIYSGPITVSIGSIGYRTELKQQKIKVIPAFVSDSSNEKKTIQTGVKWITLRNEKYQLKEVFNTPLKSIRICELEFRGNGGRAYKVIADDFYVDLREDVLMDSMLNVGIKAGGIIEGDFVWAKVGSQMKLIRKDSEVYKSLSSIEDN